MEDNKGREVIVKVIPREDEVTSRDCADMLLSAGYDWTDDDRPVIEIAIHYKLVAPSPQRVMANIASKDAIPKGFPRKRGW